MTQNRNYYEIRVFGLKRAGNHAIINWIAEMASKVFNEPVYFLNSCGTHKADPFRTHAVRGDKKGTEIDDMFIKLPNMSRWKKDEIESIRFKQKKCLLYSYEDFDIKYLLENDFVKNREYTIGLSNYIFNIIIIRDLFNWMASVIKAQTDSGTIPPKTDYLLRRWKIYAQYYLDKITFPPGKTIYILFNNWFSYEEYRKNIAKKLSLTYSDQALKYVGAPRGRGSSFDGMKHEKYADQMDVLNRWKFFRNNPILFEHLDNDAISMSNTIFGRIFDIDLTLKGIA